MNHVNREITSFDLEGQGVVPNSFIFVCIIGSYAKLLPPLRRNRTKRETLLGCSLHLFLSTVPDEPSTPRQWRTSSGRSTMPVRVTSRQLPPGECRKRSAWRASARPLRVHLSSSSLFSFVSAIFWFWFDLVLFRFRFRSYCQVPAGADGEGGLPRLAKAILSCQLYW